MRRAVDGIDVRLRELLTATPPRSPAVKRFHAHVRVTDLSARIAFHSKRFGAAPTRVEADCTKWMLDDPRLNFAISARGGASGVDHQRFQVDEPDEPAELKARAQAADLALRHEGRTACCHARSDKRGVTDPQGIAREHDHTLADIPVFDDKSAAAGAVSGACCAPRGKPVGVAVGAAGSCC